MNPLAVAGVAAGSLYVLTRPGGVVVHQSAGAADTAAMASLRQTIAGVDCAVIVGANGKQGLTGIVNGMLDAFVDRFGAYDGAGGGGLGTDRAVPRDMTRDQLIELCDAWLAAWRAGWNADGRVFTVWKSGGAGPAFESSSLVDRIAAGSWDVGETPDSMLSPVGIAVTSVAWIRHQLVLEGAPETVDQPDEIETWDRVVSLATEMDGADFTVPGVRPGDNDPTILGGLEAAGEAVVEFVEDVPGRALGAAAAAIVGSNVFWFGAFALIAWRVMR